MSSKLRTQACSLGEPDTQVSASKTPNFQCQRQAWPTVAESSLALGEVQVMPTGDSLGKSENLLKQQQRLPGSLNWSAG